MPRRHRADRRPRRADDRDARDRRPLRYSVAWIDTLARGRALGRSVLTRGEHARARRARRRAPARRPARHGARGAASAPRLSRRGLVTAATVRGVQRAVVPQGAARAERDELQTHRDVLPPARRRRRLEPALRPRAASCSTSSSCRTAPRTALRDGRCERLADAGHAVVPRRAQAVRPGQPRPAVLPDARLDPRAGPPGRPGARPACSTSLDELVVGAGGRVYLAKDSRLRRRALRGDVPAARGVPRGPPTGRPATASSPPTCPPARPATAVRSTTRR